MSICDAMDGWDDLTPEERFEQMKDWVQEYSREWGMDPPDVVNADAVDDNGVSGPSGYDHESNTIYLGPSFFSDDGSFSPEQVTGEAAHELRHAMQWQYYGEWTKYAMPHDPREADAQAFGDAVRDYAQDECDEGDDSAPEDAGGDDGAWALGDEEEEGDDEAPPRNPRPREQEDGKDG